MQAHHCCYLTIALTNLLDETFIFGDPTADDITVGDLVAQRGTQTRLADSSFNQVKGTIPHGRRSMMINYRSCAVTDAVNQWELGRQQDILFAQGTIHLPP